jgi:hypothetical protein
MVPRRPLAAACALGVAAALAVGACGHPSEEAGITDPAREGLAIPIGGIDYNVFITRQLNLDVTPDNAFYKGPSPGKDSVLYGIFLQACNNGSKPRQTAERFTVIDSQGNEFEPLELPKDNDFAYHAKRLGPNECIPEIGSVAQQGPTGGAVLIYKFPISVTENRPLELEVEAPFDPNRPRREKRSFELDL